MIDSLQRILDSSPALLVSLDADLRFTFANRAFQEWLGVTAEAIHGRFAHEVLSAPAYGPGSTHLAAALAGRTESFEHPAAHPTRGTRWLAVTAVPDFDAQGAVQAIVLTLQDVTDRKSAERHLEAQSREIQARSDGTLLEREAHLRAILESAVDAIITIDERGAVSSFNPAAERLFGYRQDEVIGRNVNTLMPSPYREEHDRYVGSYVRTSQPRIIGSGREVEARRKNGEIFPIHLSVGEARLGDKRIFTGIIHDLSGRKHLEDQLAQSQKMEAVGRLAGGVAHDFNNILLTILGRSDALLRGLPTRSPLRRQVTEIRKAGQRAAALTQQLLAVSRSQVLKPQLVDLNAVLRDTAEMLSRLIGEDVDFQMDLAAELGCVRVDPHQIVQVVLNLVVNARDAMPRGGRLAIETQNIPSGEAQLPGGADAGVRLVVRDTGVGMSEETQTRIFEPYFTTKGDHGTGLGLSTVYGIVKQSGGVLRVDSALGKGSTFVIDLPEASGRPESVVEVAPARPTRGKGGRVLLVEDDRAARRALEEFLKEEGHSVSSASSGDEAERLCREAKTPFDIVVSDTVMPRMSGPQMVEQLRILQPGLKVIFMSGHTPETVVAHGDITSGSVFLQKPFAIDDLLGHVRRLLTPPPAAVRAARRRVQGSRRVKRRTSAR